MWLSEGLRQGAGAAGEHKSPATDTKPGRRGKWSENLPDVTSRRFLNASGNGCGSSRQASSDGGKPSRRLPLLPIFLVVVRYIYPGSKSIFAGRALPATRSSNGNIAVLLIVLPVTAGAFPRISPATSHPSWWRWWERGGRRSQGFRRETPSESPLARFPRQVIWHCG